MNKKFTKLMAALALLVFMTPAMVGWGQTATYSLTPDQSSTGSTSTSYITTLTEFTYNSISWKMNQWNPKTLQIKTNQSSATLEFRYYNTSAFSGRITQVVMTFSALTVSDASKLMFLGGTSEVTATTGGTAGTWNSTAKTLTWTPAASDNFTYFAFYQNGKAASGTNYLASADAIVVTYETSGGNTPSMSVSTNSIDFGSNVINPTNPYTETFDVTFANLTENLTVTGFTGVSVSPTTINYNATSPQTVTVSYNPTAAGSISGNISVNSSEVTEALVAVTGSAYDPANVDTYELYTGEIVEGDYVIYNTHGAMKNELNGGPRFNNESVTISGDIITNPANSVIWHIAPIENTEYWTIYNAAINKYAGGTTSKNQGALYDDYTDNHAKWKIYYSYSTLYIENLGRSQDASDSGNKYLRQNSTASAGWATYANSNSYVPMLYKKVIANQVAKPSFSVAEGTYYETQSITLSCATDGATIYYTTDGSTPSASNGTEYTTVISVSTTTTIKAIAVKSGMADSDVATATYTIEQPYSTIPALFAAATATEQDVRVTFGNWVVSGVSTNGKSVYVTDNSGNGFIIYFTSDMSSTFSAGKILSGTAVACKLKLYYGAAELVNLNASDLTITDGGTVSTVNIAMANLSGVNTGALVHYDNLTCTLNNNKNNLSDGTTTLQAYNTLYDFNEFVNGKIYNVTGVYVQYNSTKQIAPRSAADIVEVEVQHEEYTLTVSNLSHVELNVFNASDQSNAIISGAGSAQVYDGTSVLISVSPDAGYVIQSLMVDGEDVTSQIVEDETYTFTMPTHNVTISATAVEYVAPTSSDYVRITSLDQLTDGSKVIIASRHNSTATSYYAMHSVFIFPGKPTGVQFTSIISNSDEMLPTTIADDEDNYYWTVNVINDNEYMFTNSENKIIACSSGETSFYQSTSYDYEWTIQRSTASSQNNQAMVPGYTGFVITNRDVTNRAFAFNGEKFGDYNTTNMNTSSYNFFLDFFVQSSEPTQTFTVEPDQWYLISSPVGEVSPENVGNMTADGYALYRFDQNGDNEGKEWINYKNTNSNYGGFNLEFGKGYLYANQAGCTLSFTGTPVAFSENNNMNMLPLTYVEGADLPGYNLLGNPFNQKVYVDGWPYYVMNSDGDAIIEGHSGINPMQGFFVIADGEDEVVTLILEPTGEKGASVALNVSRNRGNVIDRVRVRFGESRQLPKFQLFENSTKVYIPQNGKDYAVVRSEGQGELPVNFRASENGTYTLSFDAENVDMNYLHLIDNMTGMDVDLLQTPSYTFEATTRDYESRFRLVFAGNNANADSDNFAFFSNGNLIINNEGNATLQVIDLTGRILSSESVNGSVSTTLNATPGVYMLRLINGENVKVQKIVVR